MARHVEQAQGVPAGREGYLGRTRGKEGQRVDGVNRELKSIWIRVVARGRRGYDQRAVPRREGAGIVTARPRKPDRQQ